MSAAVIPNRRNRVGGAVAGAVEHGEESPADDSLFVPS
ncbi:MAG: hypothetical protein QOC81_246, partial [Thermoanaerobaculia bacterium]|nr:hypothetical protein [Thermoanaerobaculia bacterium]